MRIVCQYFPGSHALSGAGKFEGLWKVASKWNGALGVILKLRAPGVEQERVLDKRH